MFVKISDIRYLVVFALILSLSLQARSNDLSSTPPDTVFLKASQMIMLKDSIIAPMLDTMIILPEGLNYKIKDNPYYKSKAFYDSLFFKTRKSKFFRELYNLTLDYKPHSPPTGKITKADDEFRQYSGKRIHSIQIVKPDILEGSVYDTTKKAQTGIGKFVNHFHIHTQDRVIRKSLLIKAGDDIDPDRLADNERILRRMPGVEDARIEVVPSKNNPDEVDLIVIVKDYFPWMLGFDVKNKSRYEVKLKNSNFLGSGQGVSNTVMVDLDHKPVVGNNAYYEANNIFGTFVNSKINYFTNYEEKHLDFNFRKYFLTPETKYGGAVDFGWREATAELGSADSLYYVKYDYDFQDFWLGRSFQIGGKDSRKNITFSGRFVRYKYENRPWVSTDSNYNFHNRHSYLASLRYSKVYYYTLGLLKFFGRTEDIPAGYVIGITGGYLEGEYLKRPYVGAEVRWGKYFDKFGYLSSGIQVGSLINKGKFSQGLLMAQLKYFSPLSKLNRFSIRHFVNLDVYSIVTNDISKSLDFNDALSGFNDQEIKGQSTLILKYEAVFFAPWYFIGFRFAPYLHSDLGIVSRYSDVFRPNDVFYSFGIGIRIRNESLAYNTIVIRLSYFPKVTSGGNRWNFNLSGSSPRLYDNIELRKPIVVNNNIISGFQ